MIDSTIIDSKIREYLRELIENYDPQKMYLEEKKFIEKSQKPFSKS